MPVMYQVVGFGPGRRPPLGSSQAERSVISEVKRVIINNIISAIMNAIGQRRRIILLWCSSTVYTVIFFVVIKCTVLWCRAYTTTGPAH